MIRLLESAAAASPDRIAVVTPEGSTSYAGLLADAHRVAAALHGRGVARFAIVEADAAWVLRLLAGAALAGVEPCQYQPDTATAELARHLDAHGHTVVVSRRNDLDQRYDVVLPEELTAGKYLEVLPDPASQPLLIRTTGTTGTPKAARHDWRVLARTVAGLRPQPDQRWLLAYGPHQFAGVQVLLHVMASQATLVAPFPRQPRDGLDALLNDGVTCVSATPTYWRFLLMEAASRKVDLPPLAQVTLGGEASPTDLLEALTATFPGARISQVYASTELGSIASVRDGRPGFALDSVYEANPTSSIRVVDGELWVRASAGMVGSETDDWHATGDLVEVVGDRVVFRGRTSEVINVGGVKVHPLPIENKIVALDRVAGARVFGRPNPLTGAVVAVEVVPSGDLDEAGLEDLRRAIKAAVADLPRAWHPRSVAFVESIGTQGGKTVRRTEA